MDEVRGYGAGAPTDQHSSEPLVRETGPGADVERILQAHVIQDGTLCLPARVSISTSVTLLLPMLPMSVSPEVPNPLRQNEVPDELHREWRQLALLGVGVLAAMAVVLSVVEELTVGLYWLLVGLACWKFVLWQCYKRLHLNCSSDSGRCYASLGSGNRITLLRGLFIAATAGFLAIAQGEVRPWLLYVPAVLYTMAALGDWLDGYMARRQQQTTRLGAELDTVLDAFGLVVAPLLAVLYDKLHLSYLLVSIAYYLFQWGIHWRQSRGKPVYPLPPSQMRRYLAGVQMALVAIALWPPLPVDVTRLLGIALMIPLLLGFCRDWLYVSGRIGVGREPAL